MKVGFLIVLLLVGADGYRKKRKTAKKNDNNNVAARRSAQENSIEVAEQEATTNGRIHCPDNRFDDAKSQVCIDGKTGAVLCRDLCDACCTKPYDPCEDKEVGDVCHLNEDDIPPSFLQQEEEVLATRKMEVTAEKDQRSGDCANVPLAKNKWNHPTFSQCNFWGDPHFTRSFFATQRFDFQGIGVFQVASSKDNSFEVQSFQCVWNHHPRAAVAVGFAIKMDGRISFVSKKSETFVSNDKCFRFDVRSRHTHASPGHYNDMSLAIKSDLKSSAGMCGHPAPHNEVPCGAEHLFTQEQIQEMCQVCTHPKPRDCTQACVKPTPAPPPPPPPTPPPCENLREAQKACCSLEDDVEFEACVMDYCVAGPADGEAMADDAVNEVMHDVHTCQLEDSKKKCKPKQKPPPTGRCHRMGFQ